MTTPPTSSLPPEPTKGELDSMRRYLTEKKLLIADTNKTSRASIASAMVDLGAKSTNMLLTSGIHDATEAIGTMRPDIIFADYNLGDRCGLELIQVHRSIRTDIENLLFVLVTGNSQESAVAEAAEEDVDSYILKPFTMDTLKRYIVQAVAVKVQPSPYKSRIAKGKAFLLNKKYDEALAEFRDAKKNFEAPSLACYYEGQTLEEKNDSDGSEVCYEEGLYHNQIHYKCSVALFDVWAKKGKNEQAYELIKKLIKVFPLNPQRLCKTIDLAIRTRNFDDVGQYYEVFTRIQERREDLKKYVCAALVVGAISQFRKGASEAAVDLMNKAAVTAAGNTSVLREIVLTLAEYGQTDVAETVLKRFPADAKNSSDFHIAEYTLVNKVLSPGEILARGRNLLKLEVHEPAIYRILIRRTAEAGHADTAETLAHDGGRRWPKLQDEMLALAKLKKP